MKKINIIAISAFIFLMFSVTSCQKKWINPSLNKDPNAVTDVPGFALLPSAEAQMAYIVGGTDVVGITSMWVQYTLGVARQSAAMEGYILHPSDVSNVWGSFYDGGMMDTKILMDKSMNPKSYSPIYGGISKVLMAVWLGNATDLWGAVPYSKAFQGAADLTPTYDSQPIVFDTIQSLLSSAVNLLAQSPSAFDINLGTQDLFFGGNATKWTRVAWALKARYYLQTSNKNPAWATDVINIIENEPIMKSNADNLTFKFGTGPSAQNPIYQFEDQRGDMRNGPGFFASLANDNHDPRALIYQATAAGAHAPSNYYAGMYYGEKDSPVELMTYSELMFIAAEAYHATGNYTEAKAYLIKGITASIDKYMGIDPAYDAAAPAWLAAKILTYASPATIDSPSLQEIIDQKYVADYLKPESYVDYRRTGFPVLTSVNSRGIPDRYPYSTDEQLYNKNTPKTTLYTPMWFQK